MKNVTIYGSLSLTNEYDTACYSVNVSILSTYCSNLKMTIYNFNNFLFVTSLCYQNGLIPCPINYASTTGYYPNCCEICKIYLFKIYLFKLFKNPIKILVNYSNLTAKPIIFLYSNIVKSNFTCIFEYPKIIQLPGCKPKGYIQWLTTMGNITQNNFTTQGYQIFSTIGFVDILANQLFTANTLNQVEVS